MQVEDAAVKLTVVGFLNVGGYAHRSCELRARSVEARNQERPLSGLDGHRDRVLGHGPGDDAVGHAARRESRPLHDVVTVDVFAGGRADDLDPDGFASGAIDVLDDHVKAESPRLDVEEERLAARRGSELDVLGAGKLGAPACAGSAFAGGSIPSAVAARARVCVRVTFCC